MKVEAACLCGARRQGMPPRHDEFAHFFRDLNSMKSGGYRRANAFLQVRASIEKRRSSRSTHGSKSSSSAAFLEAVNPKVCIVSSGKGNPFDFPRPGDPQKAQRLRVQDLEVDEVGAIEVSAGREGFQIKSFR